MATARSAAARLFTLSERGMRRNASHSACHRHCWGVQTSAHGTPRWAAVDPDGVQWDEPHRRVAPGQSVVFYEGEEVVGGGLAA